MCLRLVNDPAPEVREEASRGLTPAAHKMQQEKEHVKFTANVSEESEGAKVAQGPAYPSFPSFMTFIADQLEKHAHFNAERDIPLSSPTHPMVMQKLLPFMQEAFIHTAKSKDLEESDYVQLLISSEDVDEKECVAHYQKLIENAFELKVGELQSCASQALLHLVKCRPEYFAPDYTVRLDWLKGYLLNGQPMTRETVARLLAVLSGDLKASVICSLSQEMLTILKAPLGLTETAEVAHGACLGLGVLVAECVQRNDRTDEADGDDLPGESFRTDATQTIVGKIQLAAATAHPVLAAAACISIGRIGQCGVLPLPLEDSASCAEEVVTDSSKPPSDSVSKRQEEEEKERARKKQRQTDAASASHDQAVTTYTRLEVIAALLNLTKGTSRKGGRVAEQAIAALGKMTVGDRTEAVVQKVLHGLFSLAKTNHEEVHFAVGQSLAAVSTGRSLLEAWSETNVGSSAATPAAHSKTEADTTEEVAELTNLSASSSEPAAQILHKIIEEHLPHGSKVQRAAACTWLLCMCKYAGDNRVVRANFSRIQGAFSLALTDSNQFTQECASKGMALVYEHGNSDMQEHLIKSLLQTFSVGKRAVRQDTEVVIDNQSGEYSTYKELCQVANEIGQPDLIYKFLDLASHHSIWNSKMGAAFSLGSIVSANRQLAPHLHTLIPKLYRYQYDPNPKIKETMKTMWQTLVTDTRDTLDSQFKPIMIDLIKCMTGRQWRERHSANLATCDLIAMRRFDQVGEFLEQLWLTNFRTLDDVNESVRKTAQELAKSLTKISVRMSDFKYSKGSHVQPCLEIVLPVLLNKGIIAHAQEVRSVALEALLQITKVAGTFLRPHLAGLLSALLEGMSTLESAGMSYLQFHAQSMNMSEEQFESIRLSMSKTTPLADAIDACLQLVDEDSIVSVLNSLCDILRAGVGLPTLTAAAKMVGTLANTPALAPHMAPKIKPVMLTLYNGLLDKSPSVRKSYATALGYCCKIAPHNVVAKSIRRSLELYTKAEAADVQHDTSRIVSGISMREIARYAGDRAREFSVDIVPVAFVAMHDANEEVSTPWKEIWSEIVYGDETGAVLYCKEIVSIIIRLFGVNSWTLKKTAILCLAKLSELAKKSLNQYLPKLMEMIIESLGGRTWEGKEVLFSTASTIAKHTSSHFTKEQVRALLESVMRECAKKHDQGYREAAITGLGKLCEIFPEVLVFEQGKEVLSDLLVKPEDLHVTKVAGADTKKSAKDEMEETRAQDKKDNIVRAAAYRCLGYLWPHRLEKDKDAGGSQKEWWTIQKDNSQWLLDALVAGLKAGLPWNVRSAILESIQQYGKNMCTSSDNVEGYVPLLDGENVKNLIEVLLLCTGDNKFATVRQEAVKALTCLLEQPELFSLVEENSISKTKAVISELEKDKDSGVLRLLAPLTKLVFSFKVSK